MSGKIDQAMCFRPVRAPTCIAGPVKAVSLVATKGRQAAELRHGDT